jgi:hypothetical protein
LFDTVYLNHSFLGAVSLDKQEGTVPLHTKSNLGPGMNLMWLKPWKDASVDTDQGRIIRCPNQHCRDFSRHGSAQCWQCYGRFAYQAPLIEGARLDEVHVAVQTPPDVALISVGEWQDYCLVGGAINRELRGLPPPVTCIRHKHPAQLAREAAGGLQQTAGQPTTIVPGDPAWETRSVFDPGALVLLAPREFIHVDELSSRTCRFERKSSLFIAIIPHLCCYSDSNIIKWCLYQWRLIVRHCKLESIRDNRYMFLIKIPIYQGLIE